MADDAAPADMQDKPTEPDYRALCDAMGWPPIAGGSPEDAEGGNEADAPDAPDQGQAEGGEESFTDFNLDDVPDEARPHVEALQKQWQGSYTQKRQAERQELGEVRREAERAQQLIDALKNPQTAPAVLTQLGVNDRELLEAYGYDLDDEDDDEFDEFDPDDRIERLENRLDETTQAFEQRQREETVADFIAEQIEALEQKEEREFDAKEHQLLDTYARANPRPDGAPDVEGAFELLTGIVTEHRKTWAKGKKNVPRPPGGGKPGSRTVDPSKETPQERQERLEATADETRGSVAA